jgi:hypothetical protein
MGMQGVEPPLLNLLLQNLSQLYDFNLLETEFFLNVSTPCILNVSNTETKQCSIMK